jgi:hypothetical protein
MKKIIPAVFLVVVLVVGVFLFMNKQKPAKEDVQLVLEKTNDISRQYVALRYETDNILLNANNYPNYADWNNDLTKIISDWESLDKNAVELEGLALKMAEEKTSFNLVPQALAYDKKEISDIFDKAPAGKKIATLAKHLGVDAKMAFKILQQDQAQVEADAWNEAGDTFQKLETSAVVIKDGCKVAGFVGTIALTGGTAAIASGSALGQAAVVVSGADLVLEITDDGAKIALGNHNKISTIVGDIRVVTEPAASILMIADLPKNLTKGIEKLNAVSFGLDQFNSSAQEGKVIGIKLPAYTGEKTKQSAEASVMEKAEIKKWLTEQGVDDSAENIETVEKILNIKKIQEDDTAEKNDSKDEKQKTNQTSEEESKSQTNENSTNEVVGIWEGEIKFTPSASEAEQSKGLILEIKSDGTASAVKGNWNSNSWELVGNLLRFYGENKQEGYHEFSLSGNTLTFVKIAGPDQEDPSKWAEVLAGSDFFGGRYMEITLVRQ